MKFCSKCGKPLTDDMNFCSACGHKVEKDAKIEDTTSNNDVEKHDKKIASEPALESRSTNETTESKQSKEVPKIPDKPEQITNEKNVTDSKGQIFNSDKINMIKIKDFIKNHKKIVIGVVVVLFLIILMMPRTKIVGKDMTVELGDDVYLTKSNLIDTTKSTVESSDIKIESNLMTSKYNYNSTTGLVKSYGLTYLDAGTYEVKLIDTEDNNVYTTVKVNVVDQKAPKFIDFQKEIEIDKGDSTTDLKSYFKAQDKSKVTISIDKGKLNTSKEGKYKINVTAKDSSGNKTTKPCTVKVVDKKLVSIEASYAGLTTAGTSISNTSNIKVVANYEDGSSKEVKGWSIETPVTLAADQTSTVKVIYKDQTYDLSIQCSTLGEQGFKNACGDLAYEELARNADGHQGEKVKYSGRIVQVTNGSDGSVTLRVATSGNYDDIILVEYEYKDGQSKLLEDDRVTVYGTIYGDYTYESVMGAHITVPLVLASYIDR